MKSSRRADIIITGIGITSAIGQGRNHFASALINGQHAFDVMRRPGRQVPVLNSHEEDAPGKINGFIGAEIRTLVMPEAITRRSVRTASLSSQVALATLHEAWNDAALDEVPPSRIGLVVGGSNLQQREMVNLYDQYRDRYRFVRPTYGFSFMDTDLCGICTAQFNIRGLACTIGGASASGQLSLIQAIHAVQSGQVDVCLAMGALMDLSYWECLGFRSLGAMGSDRFAGDPAGACRPFDSDRDGFIYGESCGVVVVESAGKRRGKRPYGRVCGWAMELDGNRNPNPSLKGEISVIQNTMKNAKLEAEDIDYINPHGTGSLIGDEIELNAIQACGLGGAYLNATKSITGHGLSSSGTVEVIATLLQMRQGRLHPTRNLEKPIACDQNWVGQASVKHEIRQALSLSFGFGGINTAICLAKD